MHQFSKFLHTSASHTIIALAVINLFSAPLRADPMAGRSTLENTTNLPLPTKAPPVNGKGEKTKNAPTTSTATQVFIKALAAAYMNNPTLAGSRKQLEATNEGVNQALSGWRPTVDGKVNHAKNFSYPNSPSNKAGSDLTTSASAQINQSIYSGGQTIAATKAAESRVKGQRFALISTEQNILTETAKAYHDVFYNQEVMGLYQANIEALKRKLEEVSANFAAGVLTLTDESATKAQLADGVAKKLAGEAELQSSQATYEKLVGEKPGTLRAPEFLGELPKTYEELLAAALHSNPDLLSSEAHYQETEAGVDQTEGGLLPRVDVGGQLQRSVTSYATGSMANTINYGRQRGNSGQISATLSIPIFEGGLIRSKVRQATESAGKAKLDLAQRRRDVAEACKQLWEQHQATLARIEALLEQVKAAEVALEGFTLEAEVGVRTITDVLTARSDLLKAQVSLVEAKRNKMVLGYKILTVIGRMTAQYLALPVELYDAEAKYQEVRDRWW